MKVYKTVTETLTRSRLENTICDICGKSEVEWEKRDDSSFYDEEVTIKHCFGHSYPSGGSGEELELDICPPCFVDKIMVFIKDIAYRPIEYKDWDY